MSRSFSLVYGIQVGRVPVSAFDTQAAVVGGGTKHQQFGTICRNSNQYLITPREGAEEE